MRDNIGSIINDTTLFVVSGLQRIDLNFAIPIASDMQLGVANNSLQNNGLYRNNSGANYPYDIASAITITSSSANTDPYSYYYFFYDIEVEIVCDEISTGMNNMISANELVKSIDILGREAKEMKQIIFYLYDDGKVEKRIRIE